jgi:hypothetical protein
VYGAGWNQVPIIEASRRRGLRVVVIDRDPKAPGASLADRFHCISLHDHDAIVKATADEELDGIVARITDAPALASAHRLARSRGLPTACPALVEAATSKLALAEICRGAGLHTPARLSLATPIAFDEGAVVVRPDVTVEGKSGIRRVVAQADFEAACAEAAARSANARVDVSRWIEGEDVSVLAELDRGRARRHALWDEWVALDREGRIHGVGCGMPSRFEDGPSSIDDALALLARAFDQSRCLVVVSFRIDPAGRAWLIEIHLGVGGDGIADRLLPAALQGWDSFELLVRSQSGEPTETSRAPARPRALIRGGSDWELVVAGNVADLHAHVRAAMPADWEWPRGLRPRSEVV